jgi:hypothetical protein
MEDEILKRFKENSASYSRVEQEVTNFEKNEKIAEFYNFREYVLSNSHRIRIFLILYLKKLTWLSELMKKFDIHPRHTTPTLEKFKEFGVLDFIPYVEVEDLLFETVWKLEGTRFYAHRDEVKVYNLSEKGEDFAKYLIDDIFELSKKDNTLSLYVNEIIKRTETHRELYKSLLNIEKTQNERYIQYPDGLIETRKTERKKAIERETKIALEEIKQERLQQEQVKRLEE